MGLFDFLGGKPSKTTATSGKSKTLVAIDWEKAQNRIKDFAFLDKYDNPVVWFFYKTVAQTEKWKDIPSKRVVPVQLPNGVRSTSHFLNNSVVFEIAHNPAIKKVVIVSPDFGYPNLMEFLKEKGVAGEEMQFGRNGRADSRDGRRNERGERSSERGGDRSSRNERNDRNGRGDRREGGREAGRENTRQPLDPVQFEKDLRHVVGQFASRYEVGQTYKKSFFGMLIKQSTGRTVQEVFRTRNAKLFLNTLIENGILTEVDSQHYKVEQHPTLELLMSLNPEARRARREEAIKNGELQPYQNGRGRGRGGRRNERNGERSADRAPRAERENPAVGADMEKSELERDADRIIERYEEPMREERV
jgi:hypothetical protein